MRSCSLEEFFGYDCRFRKKCNGQKIAQTSDSCKMMYSFRTIRNALTVNNNSEFIDNVRIFRIVIIVTSVIYIKRFIST